MYDYIVCLNCGNPLGIYMPKYHLAKIFNYSNNYDKVVTLISLIMKDFNDDN